MMGLSMAFAQAFGTRSHYPAPAPRVRRPNASQPSHARAHEPAEPRTAPPFPPPALPSSLSAAEPHERARSLQLRFLLALLWDGDDLRGPNQRG